MQGQELYNLIQELIIDAAELDPMDIAPEQDLIALGMDSLAGLEVTVNLEKRFKVKVPATRYQEMTSIKAIGSIILELVEAKEADAA